MAKGVSSKRKDRNIVAPHLTINAQLGDMPEWNLADLYPGPDSPAIQDDLARGAADADSFAADYKGKVSQLSADELAGAIGRYEALSELQGRIMSYAGLLHAGDMLDEEIGRFYQSMQEQVTSVASMVLFFTLELNLIDEDVLARHLAASADLARYGHWIKDARAFRPHQLSDEMERLLNEKQVAGRSAWVRLFDETMASLTFSVDGRELSLEQTLHLLEEPDGAVRKTAAKALGATFKENLKLFAYITNTLAKDKETEDRWRNFAVPEASRHLANQVEGEVVEALRQAVVDAYPRLSHRYYALKARWFGVEALDYWDRNAPLPDQDDRIYRFEEARDIVLDAYGGFAPEMAQIGGRFFDNAWIDAVAREGKSPGAFAHPTVPSAHPYLLLNYQGRTRDVMTLAHELGHGVHQVLAAEQGMLLADTPLTLAETASVFGEQLVFRALLSGEDDPKRRKAMLAGKVQDMLNTVVRQIAFYDFELRLHRERRNGEISTDRIAEIWLAVQGESLGPAIRTHEEYGTFWCYIPHFIHSPFYVYAYAFGDCLVNSLYAVYLDAEAGFQAKYFDLLKAGGSKHHKELLAPFDLDASDPDFWQQGLKVIEGFIDELEALDA
jgi:oligoendopeptidase F